MKDVIHAFAVPGESHLIDAILPGSNPPRSAIENETLEEIRLRYPGAEIVVIDEWLAAKAAKQDAPVTWHEISQESWHNALECLPPITMHSPQGCSAGFLVGEPADHYAGTGQSRYTAYVVRGGRHLQSSRPLRVSEYRTLTFSE